MSFQIIKTHTVKIMVLWNFTSYSLDADIKPDTAVWPEPQYPPTRLQSIKTQNATVITHTVPAVSQVVLKQHCLKN